MQWDIAKARGVQFMAARATVGNYYADLTFRHNADEATRLGIYWTAYHVIRPEFDAASQVSLLFSHLGGRKPDFPIVLDVEVKMDLLQRIADPKRAKHYAPANYVQRIHQVAEMIEQRDGRTPLFYTYPDFVDSFLLNHPSLAHYKLWISNTSGKLNISLPAPTVPMPWTRWTIWQWLTDKSDDGFEYGAQSKALDRNWYNGSIEEFKAEFEITDEPKEPPTIEERVTLLEYENAARRAENRALAQSIKVFQETQSDPLLTRSGLSVKAEKATLYEPHPSRPSILTSAKRNLTKGSAVEIGKQQRWQVDTANAGEFGQLPNGYWVRMSELG